MYDCDETLRQFDLVLERLAWSENEEEAEQLADVLAQMILTLKQIDWPISYC